MVELEIARKKLRMSWQQGIWQGKESASHDRRFRGNGGWSVVIVTFLLLSENTLTKAAYGPDRLLSSQQHILFLLSWVQGCASHCVLPMKPAYHDPPPLVAHGTSLLRVLYHSSRNWYLKQKFPLLPLLWRLAGITRVGFFWGLDLPYRWLPSSSVLMGLSHVHAHMS